CRFANDGIDGIFGYRVKLIDGSDLFAEPGQVREGSGALLDFSGRSEPDVVGTLDRRQDSDPRRQNEDTTGGRVHRPGARHLHLQHARENPVRSEQKKAGGERSLRQLVPEYTFTSDRKKDQDVEAPQRKSRVEGAAERAS